MNYTTNIQHCDTSQWMSVESIRCQMYYLKFRYESCFILAYRNAHVIFAYFGYVFVIYSTSSNFAIKNDRGKWAPIKKEDTAFCHVRDDNVIHRDNMKI